MRAIIDTHVLLWYGVGDKRLPTSVRKLIDRNDRELLLSAASATEIGVKFATKKLALPGVPAVLVPQMMADLRLLPLAVTLEHGLATAELPLHHRDPFDRLLIAQAKSEGIPIITADKIFRRYPIQVVW